MNNVLLFIGALLVVALAALFGVPHFVDWNTYRGGFEAQASRLIGRDVRVGGHVNLRLLPAPYVSFENVRVADQDGRFSEPPLRIDAFTIWLSIPPLLRGAVEASEVELRRPELLLRIADQSSAASAANGAPVSGLPMSIALRSVNVKDGALRLVNSAGSDILKLEKIAGEFAAPALDGPFRFRGTVQHAGHEREVRIATGRFEDGGQLPIEGAVRVAEQASTYQLKGRLSGLHSDPAFIGEMSVQPAADRAARGKQAAKGGDSADLLPAFEVRSKLQMNLHEASLEELNIVFEQAGRPQILTGRASATFRETARLTGVLDARWLDLDRISGSDGKSGLAQVLPRLGTIGQAWLPQGIDAAVRISVEQATLGGDTVNRIDLRIEQGKDKLKIKQLSFDAPGGARLRLAGELSGLADSRSAAGSGGEALVFRGPLQVHGQNLNRSLAWLAGSPIGGIEDAIGTFSLTGQLLMAADHVGLAQMRGEVATSAFEGTADFRPTTGGQPSTLRLNIDSDRLDLRSLKIGAPRLESIWRQLQSGAVIAGTDGKPVLKPHVFDTLTKLDGRLQLRVGQLLLPDVDLGDVGADVARTAGTTSVNLLRFATGNGLKLQADGQAVLQAGRSKGALKVVVEAERPEALTALLRFVDLQEAQALESRANSVLPLRLAGIMTLGVRAGTGFELRMDGVAQSTRATLVVRADQDPANWRSGVIDVTGTLDNPRSEQLLAQVLPIATPLSIGANEPARLSARANGVPRTGISTAIELETKALEAGFSGLITLPGQQIATLAGEIGLKAGDVGDVLRLAGLRTVRTLQGRDLVLHTRLTARGEEVQIGESALRLGGVSAEVQGRVLRANGRVTLDMKAKAGEASLPALLATVLGTSQGSVIPVDGSKSSVSVWANEAVDLTTFGDIGGKVQLEAGTLTLGLGYELRRAVLDLELSPTALDLKSLSGEALGGRMSANGRLEKAAAGITLKGTAKLDGLQLEQIAAGSSRATSARGVASAQAMFTGQGLSPRGLIGTLTGQGSLNTKDVRLSRLGTEALEAAVAQALAVPKDAAGNDREPDDLKVEPEAFKALIETALSKAHLTIGSRTFAFDIGDGTVRAKPITLDSSRGRVKVTGILDLNNHWLDSEWSVETAAKFEPRSKPVEWGAAPRRDPARAAALIPGVAVIITGPLPDLARLEPLINADNLARELMVRRMEIDVDRLEAARKRREEEDVQRRKQRELKEQDESERREAEQRRSAADKDKVSAPVAPAGAGVGPFDRAAAGAEKRLPGAASAAHESTAGRAAVPSLAPLPAPALVPAPAAPGSTAPGATPSATSSQPDSTASPAGDGPAGKAEASGAVPPTTTWTAPPRPRAEPSPKFGRPPPSVFDQSRGM